VKLRLGLGAAMAVVVAGWLVIGPAQLGGGATYVVTQGVSMQPRFHTGDLAVVRPADHYGAGDVVAYRSPQLQAVVMHRIVAVEDGRYRLKGDNNSWVDPEHVTDAEMVGTLWLNIPHGGKVLGWARTPEGLAALTLLALLMCAGGTTRLRRRRRGGKEKAMTKQTTRGLTLGQPQQWLAGSAVLALGAVAVGGFALSRPATHAVPEKVEYTQTVSFGYSADVPTSAVYPSGAVKTGDPVFLKIVKAVDVTAGYRFEGIDATAVNGTVRVVAEVSDGTGWTRTVELAPERPFTGGKADASVRVDVPKLRALGEQAAKLTGVSASAYTIDVVPQITVGGTVAGQPLRDEFAPRLSFKADPLQLKVASDGESADGDALTPSEKGNVERPSTASSRIEALGRGIDVTTARRSAILGLALAVVGLLVGSALRRREQGDETARIAARYGAMLVPVDSVDGLGQRITADVAAIDALVRIAQRYDRVVLHVQEGDAHAYFVEDDGCLFRYATAPAFSGEGQRPSGGRRRKEPVQPPSALDSGNISA
jgi:signal peptidase I